MGYYIGNYAGFKVEAGDIHISTSNNFTLAKVIYYKCDDKHTCVVDIVLLKHSCSKLEFSNKKEMMHKIDSFKKTIIDHDVTAKDIKEMLGFEDHVHVEGLFF